MGNHSAVYGWLKHLFPQLGFMRFPVKFVVLTTLVVRCWRRKASRGAKACLRSNGGQSAGGLSAGGRMLGLMALIAWFAWRYAQAIADPAATYMCPHLRSAATRAFFLVAILGCLLVCRPLNAPGGSSWCACCSCVCVV